MNSDHVNAVDATMAALGTKVTYTGASVSGLGWFLSNQFFGLAGMLIGIGGLAITWYYKHKADKRLTREHELRMQRLQRGQSTPTDFQEPGVDE